jgi:multidrug resistance efflux pump
MTTFSNILHTEYYTPDRSFKILPLPTTELQEYSEKCEVASRLSHIQEQIQLLEQPDNTIEIEIERHRSSLTDIIAEATRLETLCQDASPLYEQAATIKDALTAAQGKLSRQNKANADELGAKKKALQFVTNELNQAEARYQHAATNLLGKSLVKATNETLAILNVLNAHIIEVGNIHRTLVNRGELQSHALPVNILQEPLEYLKRTLAYSTKWGEG